MNVVGFKEVRQERGMWLVQFSGTDLGRVLPGISVVTKARIRGGTMSVGIDEIWVARVPWGLGITEIDDDFDGDGLPDVVVQGDNRVVILSGSDGKKIGDFDTRLIGVGRGPDSRIRIFSEGMPDRSQGIKFGPEERPIIQQVFEAPASEGRAVPKAETVSWSLVGLAAASRAARPERLYTFDDAVPKIAGLDKYAAAAEISMLRGGGSRIHRVLHGDADFEVHVLYEVPETNRESPVGSDRKPAGPKKEKKTTN